MGSSWKSDYTYKFHCLYSLCWCLVDSATFYWEKADGVARRERGRSLKAFTHFSSLLLLTFLVAWQSGYYSSM